MMKIRAVVICAAFCMAHLHTTDAQERKVTKTDVPAAVMSAFQKTYPEAKIRGYAREIERGKTYYEIESLNGRISLDVLYLADGTLAEVEEGIAPDDLPAQVKHAVSAKHEDAKITRAEKTTRGDVVTYELRLAAGKSKWGMVLDPSGKVLKDSRRRAENEKSGNDGGED